MTMHENVANKRKAKKKPTLTSRINSALRKVWRFGDERKQCLANARVSVDRYRCQLCGAITDQKGIQVDHLKPVVDPVRGRQGWDEYINRLFCPTEGLQAICKGCHLAETEKQRKARHQDKTHKRR